MEDTLVAKINGLEICCPTQAGADYVKKVVHPPYSTPLDYRGIPDRSQPNAICMEVKGEVNFPPTIIFPTGGETSAPQTFGSVLFVGPSGGRVGAHCFILAKTTVLGTSVNGWVQPVSTPSGSNPINQICPSALLNGGYNFGNFTKDVAKYRTTYKSQTYYLNATAFNKQGTVTSAKFKPNILYTTLLEVKKTLDPKSYQNFLRAAFHAGAPGIRARKVKSDDFVHLNQKHDNHKHDETENLEASGEYDFGVQWWELASNSGGDISPVSPIGFPMYAISGLLPENATGVLNYSSKACTRPAEEGAFVVHQPLGPTQEWSDVPSGVADLLSRIPPRDMPVYSFVRTATYDGVSPIVYKFCPLYSDGAVIPGSQNATGDVPWNNLDWEMTLFEGLTMPATPGTSLTSTAYITAKSFCGLEMSPQPNSSLLPFAKLLPLPDSAALDMAAGIFHARPDSMPASANDLGTIAAALGPVIVNHIPSVVNWLSQLFSPKKKEAPKAAKKHKKNVASDRKSVASIAAPGDPSAGARAARLTAKVNKLERKVIANDRKKNGEMRAPTLPKYENNNSASLGTPRTKAVKTQVFTRSKPKK